MIFRSALALLVAASLALGQNNAPAPAPETAPPPAGPDDPTVGPGWKPSVFTNVPQYTIDVLMVSLPEDKALSLLPKLRDPATIEAAQATILEMIAHHDAALIDWPEVTNHSGSRAVSESILEQRYPTEFEQPQEPQTFGGERKPATPEEMVLRQLGKLGIIIPTSFETRNTGSTLEVDASVAPDGSAISMVIAPQTVLLLGMQNFPAGKSVKDEPMTVPQPLFRTHKVSLSLTLRNGERRLIYFSKAVQPDNTTVLFILGAKATLEIPPAAKPK